MARLTLTLLGGFQGRLGTAAPLMLPTRKSQALLAFLALPPGRPHPRAKLASLLWGGMAESQARTGLRQSLSTLRKAVDVEPPLLLVDGQSVSLDPSVVAVDVVEFERHVADGTPPALERAAALYGGELLEGLSLQEAPFEEWILAERERLRELALEALAKTLRHQQGIGAIEGALRTALRLLAIDPLQEAVHRTVMRCYVQLGRRASALRQYQLCLGVLQRELSIEPELTTKELYRDILRQRPSPAIESVPPPGHTAASDRPVHETLPRDLPLVGRASESAALRSALDRLWSGEGHVVVVSGEAGVGKSRLVAEIAAEMTERGGRVLVGRCYEAEQILPFASWVDALRGSQLHREREVVQALGPVYRRELARLLPEAADPGQAADPGPVDHRQLFESVAQIVRQLAWRRPSMLILEDLHWADEMGLRLLAFIGRRLRLWPLLVVGTVREEDLARAPLLRRTLEDLGRDGCLTEMRLAPLSREETRTLLGVLAGAERTEAAITALAQRIWVISEGNPFAVVETMRALPRGDAADPAHTVPVPGRVRDLVMRHLETLSERGLELATVAAVIGREFDFALLRHAAGLGEHEAAESLEELVRRRVVHSVGERFDFTHDRIREVAYARLLRERQRALHARIASSMETLYADRLDEQVERLADHAARGALGQKAAGYLRQAGAKAFANSANADALGYFTRALDVLTALPAGPARDQQELAVRLGLGPALQAARGYATPEVERNYTRARTLADEVGAPLQQFQALWGIWLVASHRASAITALDLGRRLLALAERLNDPALVLEGHHALWPVLVWLGHAAEARDHLQAGMAIYDRARHASHAFIYGGHDPGVCCWKVASWASWIVGHPARALEESATSLRLAKELDHPMSMIVALVWACVFHDLRRETEQMADHARTLVSLSTERDASQWLAAGRIMDGAVRAERGEPEAAIAQIRDGLAAYRSTGADLFVPYFLSLLARACLNAGRPREGLSVLAEALETARGTGELVWESELLRLEGELRLADAPVDEPGALRCFRSAIETARRQRARSWELRAAVSLARAVTGGTGGDEARRTLVDVYNSFSEGFDTVDLRAAKTLLEKEISR
jgi:DNA-binding SARP family transcriptional activator/predicted ATPase